MDIVTCRIVYHHRLNFRFKIIVNLITIIFFLDVNEYIAGWFYYDARSTRQIRLDRKHELMSSCPRAKCVLMTLTGDILDTIYCGNYGELNGTLLDIRFCALNKTSVITHEVRIVGQHIVKREQTGKVTMTCDLSYINPKTDGIVCTSLGIIIILDIYNNIKFINDTGAVVSRMSLNDLKIIYAERLFIDKHDRVWIRGNHEDKTREGRVFITGL